MPLGSVKAPVVNVELYAVASAVPALLVAPVVTQFAYTVNGFRFARVYVKVLFALLAVGVPVDTVAPLQSVSLTAYAVLTEPVFIALSNVTEAVGAKAMPVAPAAGTGVATVGAEKSTGTQELFALSRN